MAIKSLHVPDLLVPVTLCFLLVLAAQGREHNVTVTIQGQAKCKNNPSAVLSHTALHLMINGETVPGAGTTTSTGKIAMRVNLTTMQQVVSMMSNESQVLITAPPHACGAPSIPNGTVVGAKVHIKALILRNDGDAGRPQPTIAASDGLVSTIGRILATAEPLLCVVPFIRFHL